MLVMNHVEEQEKGVRKHCSLVKLRMPDWVMDTYSSLQPANHKKQVKSSKNVLAKNPSHICTSCAYLHTKPILSKPLKGCFVTQCYMVIKICVYIGMCTKM